MTAYSPLDKLYKAALSSIDLRLVNRPQMPLTLHKDRSNEAVTTPTGIRDHGLHSLPSFPKSTLHGQY